MSNDADVRDLSVRLASKTNENSPQKSDEPDDDPPVGDGVLPEPEPDGSLRGGGTKLLSPIGEICAQDNSSIAQLELPSSNPEELAALILQCQTWVELVQAVGENMKRLIQAASRITAEQRQNLTTLLAAHLCENPTALSTLVWVPRKLRDKALERLSFTVLQIGGTNVLDARMESKSGCKFVSAEHLGTRNEIWVFQAPEGNRLAMFGTGAVDAIAYDAG